MRADFHVHSNMSFDSPEPMANSIRAAIDLGFSAICFTDHFDLVAAEIPGKLIGAEARDAWVCSYAEIEGVRAQFGDQIEILLGMELGEGAQDPVSAKSAADLPELDYVLGSIHSVTGIKDFYYLDYPDHATCLSLAEAYLDENIKFATDDPFDCLAHVGFVNRYMVRQGFEVDFMVFAEKLRHLFRILIENGRGIELNTSGLRQGTGTSFPTLPVLRLYKECGGEIITVGSDSHRASDVGRHFDEAYALLGEAGFQYQTIFRQRKPTFIPL